VSQISTLPNPATDELIQHSAPHPTEHAKQNRYMAPEQGPFEE